MSNAEKMTRDFLLTEGMNSPDANSYLQVISDVLSTLQPRSQRDARRLSMARENLKGLRRHVGRMQEQIKTLEENAKK